MCQVKFLSREANGELIHMTYGLMEEIDTKQPRNRKAKKNLNVTKEKPKLKRSLIKVHL